ncbi:uncharacterized protein LOC107304718 [Oryza brachyantha]|uniref:Uncharacterized protein n=1 Tax=Oryza brachyantha TaxID=4533 RepID=J3KVT2_ORYBR|nr:uncharacterized protein LOC107304718 [Oryza brachyantha]
MSSSCRSCELLLAQIPQEKGANMPPLRPILLAAAAAVAVASLWSAACVAADIDPSGMPSPPATVSPFPFCPTTPPPGSLTQPFPWAEPSPATTLFPQDPGFLASGACRMALAWLPLAFVLSAFLVLLQ